MEPGPGWQKKDFEDASWKSVVPWVQVMGPDERPVLQPWIPDGVKALRKAFSVGGVVKSARLYSTALGTYELFMNGKRVSDSVMAPGWTDYRERVLYQTYDVTDLVKSGKNAIGALLAPGWYSTPLEWLQQPNNYGDTPPALRAQLRIEHEDGSVEWVTTDTSWQADSSYILKSELYDGETQDLRKSQNGWDLPEFPATGWMQAEIIHPTNIKVEAQEFPSIRVERALPAKAMTQPKPGVYIYDFGQNMAGVEKLQSLRAGGNRCASAHG